MTDALWRAGQSLCLQLLHCSWASSIFMTGRAAFNLTVFSAVSHTYQAQAGANPGPKGKKHSSGIWLFWKKIALAEFHLNSLSGALPLCVCVGSSYLFVLCCVESFSLDTDPFLSKSCRETTKRGQGEANGWKSKWHFLKHDFVDWRSQWIVQTVFGRVCWLSNGEKDKGQAAISKERSLAREIVANTYHTVVSFLTGSLGLGN